jgi:bacterioferritin
MCAAPIARRHAVAAEPIESCSEIVRWPGNDDPTTRRIMEDILKAEEQHADDMADLLAKMG